MSHVHTQEGIRGTFCALNKSPQGMKNRRGMATVSYDDNVREVISVDLFERHQPLFEDQLTWVRSEQMFKQASLQSSNEDVDRASWWMADERVIVAMAFSL